MLLHLMHLILPWPVLQDQQHTGVVTQGTLLCGLS